MRYDYSWCKFQKNTKPKKSSRKSKDEFCIMPVNVLYKTERESGLVRHEVFYGKGKRELSIKHGLVIFITPEMHNMSNKGIHSDKKFDSKVRKIGQKAFMKYYNKTKDEFREIFGKNYL